MNRFVLTAVMTLCLLHACGCKRNAAAGSATTATQDLVTARREFVTHLKPQAQPDQPERPAAQPPGEVFRLVHYPAPPGPLAAYLRIPSTPLPKSPAVLWCHGRSGGIGDDYALRQPARNDQTPKAFVDAGFVVMLPSWRGTNDNPGRPALFYGEVDDALAAIDYLSTLPEVDANRIYIVGNSFGGTVALLAGEMAPPGKIRAVFSFDGAPDMHAFLRGVNAAVAPFDISDPQEMRLRSATEFIATLHTPTWYFEGSRSANTGPAAIMTDKAASAGAPLHTLIVRDGTPSNILRPITQLVAEKCLDDTGTRCEISISDAQVQSAFAPQQALPATKLNARSLQMTDGCQQALQAVFNEHRKSQSSRIFLSFDLLGGVHLSVTAEKASDDCEIQLGKLSVVTNAAVLAEIGPMRLDYNADARPRFFVTR